MKQLYRVGLIGLRLCFLVQIASPSRAAETIHTGPTRSLPSAAMASMLLSRRAVSSLPGRAARAADAAASLTATGDSMMRAIRRHHRLRAKCPQPDLELRGVPLRAAGRTVVP